MKINKIKKYLNKLLEAFKEYSKNAGFIDFLVFAIVGVVGIFGVSYNISNTTNSKKEADTVESTVEATVISAEIDDSKYETVLEYLDEEYTIKDRNVYYKCNTKVGSTVDAIIEFTIYEDGTIEYTLTDVD